MKTEFYVVVGVLFTTWVAWISATSIANQRKIDKLIIIANNFSAMKDSQDKQFENTDKKIDGLSTRLDLFLNKELDAFGKLSERTITQLEKLAK